MVDTVNLVVPALQFKDSIEEARCHSIVSALSPTQLEQAAQSSYAYCCRTIANTDDNRKQMALRMVRRHLIAEKYDESKALEKLLLTLKFRESKRVNDIRNCFSKTFDNDKEMMKIRAAIESGAYNPEVKLPKLVVRGYDKRNQAIINKFHPCAFQSIDSDLFTSVQIYWTERALACTERRSSCQYEKINMVTNYNGYSRANKPPMSLVRNLVAMLQAHYPERMNLIIGCDPPFILKTIFKVVSMFLDPVTREKTKFVSGDQEKQEQLESIVFDQSQVMPYVFPNGELSSTLPAMKQYLYETPFDRDYDGR